MQLRGAHNQTSLIDLIIRIKAIDLHIMLLYTVNQGDMDKIRNRAGHLI